MVGQRCEQWARLVAETLSVEQRWGSKLDAQWLFCYCLDCVGMAPSTPCSLVKEWLVSAWTALGQGQTHLKTLDCQRYQWELRLDTQATNSHSWN